VCVCVCVCVCLSFTGWLFYTGPWNTSVERQNMTLAVSRNNGSSWNPICVIREGAAAYSSLVVIPGSTAQNTPRASSPIESIDGGAVDAATTVQLGLLYEWSVHLQIITDPDYQSYQAISIPA